MRVTVIETQMRENGSGKALLLLFVQAMIYTTKVQLNHVLSRLLIAPPRVFVTLPSITLYDTYHESQLIGEYVMLAHVTVLSKPNALNCSRFRHSLVIYIKHGSI
jgi:hypothetical protein